MFADDLPHVEVTSRAALRSWLEAHHQQPTGIWLVTYKKHVPDKYVSIGDIVCEALCFGWIDSRSRRIDDERWAVRLGPRKPGSMWSAVNKRHVAELEAQGLVAPAGQALIDAARADGSWAFLDDVEALVVPDDLDAALAQATGARTGWDQSSAALRKRALYWIKTAKRATTRASRVATVAERCAHGEPPIAS